MYIHKNFKYKLIKYDVSQEHWEGRFVEMSGGGLTKSVYTVIGNIYRPLVDLNVDYRQLTDKFATLLTLFDSSNNEVIIARDFNINLLKINEKEIFSDFFDTVTERSFFPKVSLPTRFSISNGTLTDNLFCKVTKSTIDSTSRILTKKFSDHKPLL